jgi:hypothetical protein
VAASRFGQPLTFGQLSVWRDIENLPRDKWYMSNNSWATSLPDGVTVSSVRGALHALAERHESLRTTFDIRPGGKPRQIVHPAAAIDLDVQEGGAGDVGGLKDALTRMPFDLRSEFPWRACVITGGTRPRFLVAVLNHMTADAIAHAVLRAELTALLQHRPLSAAPSLSALTAEQHSAQWVRRRDASMAYWRKVLADPAPRPPVLPPAVPSPNDPAGNAEPLAMASLYSAGACAAARTLAGRLGISTAAVILAAYYMAIFRTIGAERARVRIMSANRFDPRWRELVSSMNQWIPLIVARPDHHAFPAFASGVARASMITCRHGMYDVDEAAALCRQMLGRPDALDLDYSFNVVQLPPPAGSAQDEGAGVVWGAPFSSAGARCYLKVFEQEALTFTLKVPAHSMPRDSAEGLLCAIRDVLTEAAPSDARETAAASQSG